MLLSALPLLSPGTVSCSQLCSGLRPLSMTAFLHDVPLSSSLPASLSKLSLSAARLAEVGGDLCAASRDIVYISVFPIFKEVMRQCPESAPLFGSKITCDDWFEKFKLTHKWSNTVSPLADKLLLPFVWYAHIWAKDIIFNQMEAWRITSEYLMTFPCLQHSSEPRICHRLAEGSESRALCTHLAYWHFVTLSAKVTQLI